MRKPILLILIAAQSAGCATARLTCDEICAETGHVCRGYATTTGTTWVGLRAVSVNATGPVCVVPESVDESLKLGDFRVSADEKRNEASTENTRTWLWVGAGTIAASAVSLLLRALRPASVSPAPSHRP